MATSGILVADVGDPNPRRKRATSTISSKGQITVPIEVRERLGVKPGDRVEFVIENGLTVVRRSETEQDPFERYAGSLPGFKSMEEIVAWIRDMRDPDREYR